MVASFMHSDPHERKTARKELRLKPSDDERLKNAAAFVGLSETDLIIEAAMERVGDIERRSMVTLLPDDTFMRFHEAIQQEGKVIPGLKRAAEKADEDFGKT